MSTDRPAPSALSRLELVDVRRWRRGVLEPAEGLTVLRGPNGAGKTTVLEAVRFLSTRTSLRGVPVAGLVADGADQAVIRGEASAGTRSLLFEASLVRAGRDRFQVNRQPIRRADELVGMLPTSVFAPDDLDLVKASPSGRRAWIDELVTSLVPAAAGVLATLERVVRQRSALLRQIAPMRVDALHGDEATTLAVWDAQLAQVGTEVARLRAEAVTAVAPTVAAAVADLSGVDDGVEVSYTPSWGSGSLAEAIVETRGDELRRGVTLVGPQRDDIEISLRGFPARTHASQGEQRTLALALRLGAHRHRGHVTGHMPLLLLDDVFSELDDERAQALVEHLPAGQILLTTAVDPPPAARPDQIIDIDDGAVVARRPAPAA